MFYWIEISYILKRIHRKIDIEKHIEMKSQYLKNNFILLI
jgi:hypothetical protein